MGMIRQALGEKHQINSRWNGPVLREAGLEKPGTVAKTEGTHQPGIQQDVQIREAQLPAIGAEVGGPHFMVLEWNAA